MEDTENEEKAELYNIILNSLTYKHSGELLPDCPWFLKVENTALNILKELLIQSNHNPKAFAQEASKKILNYKVKSVNEKITYASRLRENLDINTAIVLVKESASTHPTSLEITVEKSQSIKGPITVFIQINHGSDTMQEGDKYNFPANLSGNLVLKLLLEDGNDKSELDQIDLEIMSIFESTYYFSGMERGEIVTRADKKG